MKAYTWLCQTLETLRWIWVLLNSHAATWCLTCLADTKVVLVRICRYVTPCSATKKTTSVRVRVWFCTVHSQRPSAPVFMSPVEQTNHGVTRRRHKLGARSCAGMSTYSAMLKVDEKKGSDLHAKAHGVSWHTLRHPGRVDGCRAGGLNGGAAQPWLRRRHTLYAAVYVACGGIREALMAWQQEAQPYLGNRRCDEGALEASINTSISPPLPLSPIRCRLASI
jgi:hypothetical protein